METTFTQATIEDVLAIREKLVRVAYRALTSSANGKKAVDYETYVSNRELTGKPKGNSSSHTRTVNWEDAEDAIQTLFIRLMAQPSKWWKNKGADCRWAYGKAKWTALEVYKHKSARQQLLDEEQADLLTEREQETVLFDVIESYTQDEQALMNGLVAGYKNHENVQQLGWSQWKYDETLKGIRVKGLLYQ